MTNYQQQKEYYKKGICQADQNARHRYLCYQTIVQSYATPESSLFDDLDPCEDDAERIKPEPSRTPTLSRMRISAVSISFASFSSAQMEGK